MAPADVHPNMNDPFAAFGAPAAAEQPAAPVQQTQQPGNEDPWASMNGAGVQPVAQQPVQNGSAPDQNGCADPWASMNGSTEMPSQPPAMPPTQPPAIPPQQPVGQMQNGNVDPFAGMNGQAPPMMPPQPPNVPVQQPPAPIQNANPFASMNGAEMPQQPMAPPAPVVQLPEAPVMQQPPSMPMHTSVDPWNQQTAPMPAPEQPVIQPPQMMQPNMMQPPQQQPMMQQPQMMSQQESVPTTVVCNENEASPPSPIGDQSVVGAQAANSAPEVPVFEQQPAMMPIQEQPVMPSQPPAMAPQQPSVNPFEMAPMAQPVQESNVQMPQEQPQMNSVNPFGAVDLTGQMNNLSMQNGAENKGASVAIGVGMPPVENQAPMPPNEMPPPPPSVQPPVPPSVPPMPSQQPTGMEQAPLSPAADPFAVYSPVVSPGAALSPQFNDPFGYAFSPMTSPTEGQNGNFAMPAAVPDMPFGGSVNSSSADPFAQQQQAVVPSNAVNDDPFGVFGSSAPAPANNSADPFGAPMDNNANAVAQSNQVVDDPFGIFGSPTPVQQQPPTQQPVAAAAPQDQVDPWAAAGFNEVSQTSLLSVTSEDDESEAPIELDTNGLPKQGDYYEARINARSLGAMFYTARDLENTLLYHMPTNVIDSMKSRPIVAYVAENSAAYNAGVHLGHCILSVNGTEVSNPDECADVIRNASRPMNIRGYTMPELEVTLAEGNHMVKYDKKDMGAPSSTMEWKEKYVVVGGIVAKPWMLNMYRSKAEYDIAVKETHSNYKCSVKVKQFDLRGARLILRGKDGKPDNVNYHASVWHYITILPAKGYPIKISSKSLDELEPVYAAVRRFIRKDMQTRNHGYEWK